MFSRISKGLVLSLSLAATTVAVGCAGNASGDDVGSDQGAASTAISAAHDYEGTIGNLKVLVRLDAQGANVSGSYFYSEKPGDGSSLVLKGTTSGSKITMTESVNGAGAVTGTFNGNITAAGITGTWKAGATTLPLTLTAIKSLKTVQHKFKATGKKSTQEFARECSLEAEVVEVYGVDPKISKAIGASLKVDPLDKAADGTCDSDIRYVTQTVALNASGFLTIHVATEYDGGAHPEIQSDYFNFVLATGANLTGKDIFAAGSETKIKALIEKQINAQTDLTAEDKKASIDEFETHWTDETKLEEIAIGLGEKGITIDMGNNYPHVVVELAPDVEIAWADLKPLLNPAAGLAPLAK